MKSAHTISSHKLLLTVIAMTLVHLLQGTSADAANYHVDSNQGLDSNPGTAPDAPWKTLQKANETTFQPGDSLLLKAGSQWTGTLKPQGSGTKEAPILIASYGEGAKPVIDGGGAESAVSLENQQHWAIENLELRNIVAERMVDGFLSGKHKEAGDGTKVPGSRSGITVKAKPGDRMAGLRIANCVFTKIDGSSWRLAQPGMYSNAAIHVNTEASFDDVTIENNHIHDIRTIGIIAWVGSGRPVTDWQAVDPALWGKNLVIRNNRIERTGADGIIIANSDGALVEKNICHDAGINADEQPVVTGNAGEDAMHIAGIWCIASKDAIFQFNECARVKSFATPADGMAWDVDMACRGTITYQYNYSHDNPAGTLLIMNHNKNLARVVFRYNVSVNDGTANKFGRQIAQLEALPDVQFTNNLFINTVNKEGFKVSDFAGTTYRNNVFSFQGHEVGPRKYWPSNYPAGPIFEGNAYFGHQPIVTDELKVVADPLFVNAAAAGDGLDTLKGFQLQSGSPLVGAGVMISDNGGRDFFGNPLPAETKPAIGIHQPAAQ